MRPKANQTRVASRVSISQNSPQRRWAKLKAASAEFDISVPELFRLAVSGEVKASHRIKPGRSRGTWLINLQSLEKYIESFCQKEDGSLAAEKS